MKRTILGFFTVLILFLFTPIVGVFAAESQDEKKVEATSSGLTVSGTLSGTGEMEDSNKESKKDEKEKKDIKKSDKEDKEDSDFTPEDKEKVQQEINTYILEAYKLQGNKILKDIDVSLQKINTDSETRIKAYARIQRTLEMRKKRIQNMDLSENNKTILTAYLQYMINALEKKQANLKD